MVFILTSSGICLSRGEYKRAEEVGVTNICSFCRCDFTQGEVLCANVTQDFIIQSIPKSLHSLKLNNVTNIIFRSGALQATKGKFPLNVHSANSLTFESKAISIQHQHANVTVRAKSVNRVQFQTNSVQGKGGEVNLQISDSQEVEISSKAFDILSNVQINNTRRLSLQTSAFKPNAPSLSINLAVTLSNITFVPSLPSNCFGTAKSIHVIDSHVEDLEANAFSGLKFENVRLENDVIDRIHSKAFPQFTLINSLAFVNCSITALNELAIQSAMSEFKLTECVISSMSRRGLDSQVAKVGIKNNEFKTLVNSSFAVSSWNDFTFSGNKIQFMDSNALGAIGEPGLVDVSNVSFAMKSNHLFYANRLALKVSFPEEVKISAEGNRFERQCNCDLDNWLRQLVGDDSSSFYNSLFNSSLCKVPRHLEECFDDNPSFKASMASYTAKICAAFDSGDVPMVLNCGSSAVWSFLEENIAIHTNRGILLIILSAAIFLSLIVSICTLLRWIVYTLQWRAKIKNEDEWNFTKIEAKGADSPMESGHYEKLPLTTTDESLQSEVIENSLESPQTQDQVHSDRQSFIQSENQSMQKDSNEKTESTSNKQGETATFYDEMIDLLKEKLDDPNNYASVADMRPNQELYEDPFEKNNV